MLYSINVTLHSYNFAQYKAHTLQFSVKLQTGPSVLQKLLQPERQTERLLLIHQDELWQNYLKSAISVYRLALF